MGTTDPVATFFSMRGEPLVSKGKFLAAAPSLWAHVRVFAEGGENEIHAHPREDHMFVVLDGEATFFDPDGHETVVSPFEGVMLPRDVPYRFESTGAGNLVLLRVGSPSDDTVLRDSERLPTPANEHEGYRGVPVAARERVGVEGAPARGGWRRKAGGAPRP